MKITSSVLISLFLFTSLACANTEERGENRKRPSGPPPEAIEACVDQEVGTVVSFTTRNGEELSATCTEIEGQLAAVPEGHGKRRPSRKDDN